MDTPSPALDPPLTNKDKEKHHISYITVSPQACKAKQDQTNSWPRTHKNFFSKSTNAENFFERNDKIMMCHLLVRRGIRWFFPKGSHFQTLIFVGNVEPTETSTTFARVAHPEIEREWNCVKTSHRFAPNCLAVKELMFFWGFWKVNVITASPCCFYWQLEGLKVQLKWWCSTSNPFSAFSHQDSPLFEI